MRVSVQDGLLHELRWEVLTYHGQHYCLDLGSEQSTSRENELGSEHACFVSLGPGLGA